MPYYLLKILSYLLYLFVILTILHFHSEINIFFIDIFYNYSKTISYIPFLISLFDLG